MKIMIEGIKVPARAITRLQVEGEPARMVINLWPTNDGTKILRGSHVTVFRWEDSVTSLAKHDSGFATAGVSGVWELFFDGYIDRKPTISRRENRSLVLYCTQYISRLNSVYLRTTSLGVEDIGFMRDKAFMGINPEPNEYFTVEHQGAEVSAMTRIKSSLEKDGVAKGLIALVKEALNYDDIFARVAAVANLYNRLHDVENETMKTFVGTENLLNVITGQIDRMPSSTTLMQIINQLMYQALYTAVMIPSPKFSVTRGQAMPDGRQVDMEGVKSPGLYQFLYKPQLFFAVPVKSNIIFPMAIDSMEPIQTRVDQPTRIAVIGNTKMFGEYVGKQYAQKAYYPETIGRNFTIDMDSYPAFGLGDNNKPGRYTEEELMEERLVPREIGMPFPESLMGYDQGKASDGGLAEIYGNYIFHLEKNTSEPLQIQVSFDPYLLCGISGAVLDEQFGYVLGRYRTITDTVDIDNSVAKTTIEIVNVRLVPRDTKLDSIVQIADYDNLFANNANGKTAFFDENFKNDKISEYFYLPYLGSEAISNSKDGYYRGLTGYDPIAGALSGLLSRALKISGDNAEKFMRNVKYRPVVTEAEYMGFIGAVPEGTVLPGRYASHKKYKGQYNYTDPPFGGANPESGESIPTPNRPFMIQRQELVATYVKNIKEAHLATVA